MLLDIVSIVVSILLALAVDRWRRRWEDRRTAREAAQSLLTEIRKNREEVQRALADHRKAGKTLNQPDEAPGRLNFRAEIPVLTDAAWQVLLHTRGLTLLPLPLVSHLAEMYRTQEFLQSWLDRFSDLVTSSSFFQTSHREGSLQALRNILANIENLETHQLQAYEQVIQALEHYLKTVHSE